MEYQYPIDYHWSTEEIIDVIAFFQQVEKAYEKGVDHETFLTIYRRFKEIVPGKAEEMKICNEFEKISGYSSYRTIQAVKNANRSTIIKMKLHES
ncbi:UPF0223 family protein [Bacillaceae bacterium Marseille-Q3522]|nr:UPF0223 family protein [Bacillaceae bacterium Marseille-Q3522]